MLTDIVGDIGINIQWYNPSLLSFTLLQRVSLGSMTSLNILYPKQNVSIAYNGILFSPHRKLTLKHPPTCNSWSYHACRGRGAAHSRRDALWDHGVMSLELSFWGDRKGASAPYAGQMTEEWDLLSMCKVYTCADEHFWRWMVLTAPGQYQQVHATVLLKKW